MKILLCLLCLFIFGCTHRVIDFTMISTKNFDVSQKHIKGQDRVSGIDSVPIIFLIPCGSPDMKEAIDNAIEKIPGCVGLADGVLYSKWWYIPYIYGVSWYEIEGTPVILGNEGEKISNFSIVPTIREEEKKSEQLNRDKFIITQKDGKISIIQKK